jgi:hypothetical protein
MLTKPGQETLTKTHITHWKSSIILKLARSTENAIPKKLKQQRKNLDRHSVLDVAGFSFGRWLLVRKLG